MNAPVELRDRPLWVFRGVIDFGRDWLRRFVEVQGFDRAMAISAYAYTALFPLLIVYASLLPRADSEDFADVLIKEFELSGATASSVKQAFAPAGEVQSGVTLLGVGLLLISALSFSRGLQRLYELAYGLPALGMRNTPRGVLWLVFLVVLAGVRPIVTSPFGGGLKVAVTLAHQRRRLDHHALSAARPARGLAPAVARRAADRDRHGRRRHLVGDVDAAHARRLGRSSSA